MAIREVKGTGKTGKSHCGDSASCSTLVHILYFKKMFRQNKQKISVWLLFGVHTEGRRKSVWRLLQLSSQKEVVWTRLWKWEKQSKPRSIVKTESPRFANTLDVRGREKRKQGARLLAWEIFNEIKAFKALSEIILISQAWHTENTRL